MTQSLTPSTTQITKEQVQGAVDAILEVLGLPANTAQEEALEAFQRGDYQRVKRIAATNLGDFYCKALSYLPGAYKLTPNTDTILAEAARSAAEVAKNRVLTQLGTAIAESLG